MRRACNLYHDTYSPKGPASLAAHLFNLAKHLALWAYLSSLGARLEVVGQRTSHYPLLHSHGRLPLVVRLFSRYCRTHRFLHLRPLGANAFVHWNSYIQYLIPILKIAKTKMNDHPKQIDIHMYLCNDCSRFSIISKWGKSRIWTFCCHSRVHATSCRE